MSLRKKSAIVLFGVMALGLSAHMMTSAVSEIGDAGNKNSQNYKFLSLGEKEKQNSKEKAENQNNNQSSVASSGINKKSRTSTQEQTQEIKNRIQEIRISLIPACLIVNGFLLMLAMLYWFNDGKRPISNRKEKPDILQPCTNDRNIKKYSSNKMDNYNNKSRTYSKNNLKNINRKEISNNRTNSLNINNNNIVISESYDGNKDDDKVENNVFFNSLSENKFKFNKNTISEINENLKNNKYDEVRDFALKDFKEQLGEINEEDENYKNALEDLRSRVVEFKRQFLHYLPYKNVNVEIFEFFKDFNKLIGEIRGKMSTAIIDNKVGNDVFLNSLLANKFGFSKNTIENIDRNLAKNQFYAAGYFALSDFNEQCGKIISKNYGYDLMINLRIRIMKFREEFFGYLKNMNKERENYMTIWQGLTDLIIKLKLKIDSLNVQKLSGSIEYLNQTSC